MGEEAQTSSGKLVLAEVALALGAGTVGPLNSLKSGLRSIPRPAVVRGRLRYNISTVLLAFVPPPWPQVQLFPVQKSV